MKKLLLLLSIWSYLSHSKGQLSVDANVLNSAFQIKTDKNIGTAFLININQKRYVVTAKHVFGSNVENGVLQTFKFSIDSIFRSMTTKVYVDTNKIIDVAVIDLGIKDTSTPYFRPDYNFILGQDCLFLGFPLGLHTELSDTLVQGKLIPLVKRGMISGNNFSDIYGYRIFIDGIANPGFSGGPIIVEVQPTVPGTSPMAIIGIISGFYNDDLALVTGKDTGVVHGNSGIIKVLSIKHVHDIIVQNKLQ